MDSCTSSGTCGFFGFFGANVKTAWARLRIFSSTSFAASAPASLKCSFSWGSNIPSLGASGAISGVLGAYIIFFPSSRILTLVPLFIIWFTARIPAIVFIGLWFLAQFLKRVGRYTRQALPAPAASLGGLISVDFFSGSSLRAAWVATGQLQVMASCVRLMKPRYSKACITKWNILSICSEDFGSIRAH